MNGLKKKGLYYEGVVADLDDLLENYKRNGNQGVILFDVIQNLKDSDMIPEIPVCQIRRNVSCD